MRIKIGALEISDVSLEELDELVSRYGGDVVTGDGSAAPPRSRNNHSAGSTTDTVLLKKFVDAGVAGVTTNDVGEMLGRRGKATRGAAKDWAKRIGLTSDDAIDPFEDCRNGTNRAIRIKSSLMDVARAHLTAK